MCVCDREMLATIARSAAPNRADRARAVHKVAGTFDNVPGAQGVDGCRSPSDHCTAVLARTAALRHGGEACLDFKDSASPLLEACGKVQADHTEHPRQLAWPHS